MRPKLDKHTVRSKTIRLRVTLTQARVFKAAAAQARMGLSEWLRSLANAATNSLPRTLPDASRAWRLAQTIALETDQLDPHKPRTRSRE